jgi:hypothetical protein
MVMSMYAWDYFSHDQSRSRAYRWGEDGLAGISVLELIPAAATVGVNKISSA